MVPSITRLLCAVVLAASLAAFPAMDAHAQPDLNFSGIAVNWPKIKLTFSVRCNKQIAHSFQAQHFRVFEDGVEMGQFTLTCPVNQQRCPITVALVLDASGSMMGAKNLATIQAANEFVAGMDSVQDRAAVLWFHDHDTLVQPMTFDRALLHKAVDSLPAIGTTAVWDATWDGIDELTANSTSLDSCRAVVVLTDGNDNASIHDLNALVAKAQARGVRVFTVGLGIDANGVALAHLAYQTGGRYFSVDDPALLISIYQEIFLDVAGIGRCEIEYESVCGDGTVRAVELRLENYCGGSDSDIRFYTAPISGASKINALVALPDTTVHEGDTLVVPFTLRTLRERQALVPGMTVIGYDTSCVEFLGIGSLEGTLLRDAGLTATTTPAGVVLQTARKIMLEGPGLLALLRFRVKPREKDGCCDLIPGAWNAPNGCLVFESMPATVCVTADIPHLRCALSIPDSLVWNSSIPGYVPSPFPVTLTITNDGARTARQGQAKVEVDSTRVGLITPTPVQALPDLAPGASHTLVWMVTPRQRAQPDSIILCVRSVFENAAPVRCCAIVRVPQAGDGLVCALDIPEIHADSLLGAYLPMPFTVTAAIRNAGIRATDTITVALLLPPGYRNVTPGNVPLVVRPVPAVLEPGQNTLVHWQLEHPPVLLPSLRTMMLRVTAAADTSYCAADIVLPPLAALRLDADCTAPDSLAADPSGAGWLPGSFRITVHARNNGSVDADSARATLSLPGGAQFVQPTESATKYFTNGRLGADGTSDSLSWIVRMPRRDPAPSLLTFSIMVEARRTGRIPLGARPIDTARTFCVTRLAPLPPVQGELVPRLVCALAAPDTIRFGGTRYDPDPLRALLRVQNIGTAAARDVHATLLQHSTLIPKSSAQIAIGDLPVSAVAGGDSSLYFDLSPVAVRAWTTDTVRVLLQASELTPQLCVIPVVIAPARFPVPQIVCTATPDTVSAEVVSADTGATHPERSQITVEVMNAGDADLSDAVLAIGGARHLMPDGPAQMPLGTLAPGSRILRSFTVRALCPDGGADTLECTLRGRGGFGDDIVSATCSATIVVLPCTSAAMEVECAIADTLRVDPQGRTVPDPYHALLRVHNSGARALTDVRIQIDPPPWSIPAAGSRTVTIPVIQIGETISVPWELRTVAPPQAASQVCFTVSTAGLADIHCCAPIAVNIGDGVHVVLDCTAPDSISGRAFDLCAVLHVEGGSLPGPLRIRVIHGSECSIVGGVADTVLSALDAADSLTFCAQLHAEISAGATVSVRIVVESSTGVLATCERSIALIPLPRPAVECAFTTHPVDTLRFDIERGAYVDSGGTPAGTLRVTGWIRNTSGGDTTRAVSALLLPPPGCVFADGESAQRFIGDLAPGATVTIAWTVVPARRDSSWMAEFQILISDDMQAVARCAARLQIAAAPRLVRLSMPRGLLARSGEVITVPVLMGSTRGRDVRSFRLNIAIDPTALEFVHASLSPALMQAGWGPLDIVRHAWMDHAIVRLASSASGAPLASTNAIRIADLTFRVVFGAGVRQFDVAQTELRFEPVFTDQAGVQRVASLNSDDDARQGDVRMVTEDGSALLSGSCVTPLIASEAYILEQNKPNPFNPVTTITFSLPVATHAVVDVVDMLGRVVATLTDATVDAGAHRVQWDAGDHAAGAYLCRLRADGFVIVRRMLLAK